MQETAVFAWGAGEDGQLGLGDYEDESWPRAVDALADVKVVSLVGGSRNSLAIDEAGRLYTWGWNQRATLGHPPDTKIENLPSKVVALAQVKIVQAAIGGWHCLAVDDQGRTYAWGGNEYGQCGEVDALNGEKGEKANERRDIQVPRKCAPKLRVRQVAAGGTHSVVLTDEGHVWTWGQPWPPGDITKISTPSRVQNLEKVQTIAVGAFHNLALLECGEVWAWGNNEYGQLGTGDTQPRAQPVRVKGLGDVSIIVAIAAGGWHSMALTVDGQVYGWGRGEHGRLGFGDDKSSKMVPAKVSCGGTHSVALAIDGRVYSFGRGDHGRLGYGSLSTTGHPCEVSIQLQPRKRHGGVNYIRKRSYLESPKLDSTDEKAGNWCIRLVACGGRHTLVLAAWDPDTPEDSPEE
eukprot:TRINITY_DN1187_c0_g1_i4.p1 TRINITY_DN1187_c0_g1~~TRINITY_DN1187_c0_g1_i4.p1  ORF type:complete len:406 (-),score=62.42 TRINITY_DN1187_c0_g1_i4:282-1499(-)